MQGQGTRCRAECAVQDPKKFARGMQLLQLNEEIKSAKKVPTITLSTPAGALCEELCLRMASKAWWQGICSMVLAACMDIACSIVVNEKCKGAERIIHSRYDPCQWPLISVGQRSSASMVAQVFEEEENMKDQP